MDTAFSKNNVLIRLTSERWFHIVENHDEVAGYYDEVLETVENPDIMLRGYKGSLIAVKNYGHKRYLMVIYREITVDDGFIITAYFSKKIDRKKAIWKNQ
jgi:hypothetical protein